MLAHLSFGRSAKGGNKVALGDGVGGAKGEGDDSVVVLAGSLLTSVLLVGVTDRNPLPEIGEALGCMKASEPIADEGAALHLLQIPSSGMT